MSLAAYIIVFVFAAITLLVLLASLLHYLILSRKKQFYQALAAFGVTAMVMLAAGVMIGTRTCNFVIEQFSQVKKQANAGIVERAESRRRKVDFLLSAVPEAVRPRMPEDFYSFSGQNDWWRIPLVFPYQMIMKGDFYLGNLEKFKSGVLAEPQKSSAAAITLINKIACDRKMLLFQRNVEKNSSEKQEWGIFEFKTGQCVIFSSENAMFKAALDKDYDGELKLHSLLYQYRDFYK